jgi:hypothetical protein
MPDQVPFGFIAADLDDLDIGFLNFVLSENRNAGVERFVHYQRRVRLADGHELDLICVSAGARRRALDPFPYRRKIPA